MEEKNIGSRFCHGILFESIVRQSDSAKQITAFGKVTPCLIVHLVHSELRCYDSHNAAGLDLIYAFYGKVIVYLETEFIISLIRNTVITERNITNDHIERIVIESGLFKSCNLYSVFGVQKLCNSAAYRIKFHTVQL